jgi:hypothetical protein
MITFFFFIFIFIFISFNLVFMPTDFYFFLCRRIKKLDYKKSEKTTSQDKELHHKFLLLRLIWWICLFELFFLMIVSYIVFGLICYIVLTSNVKCKHN